jgi:hypothetical protein
VSGSFGVQPRAEAKFSFAPLQYHGGPVLTSSVTYAIYWDPVGAYRSDWLTLIDRYFHDVGADSGKLTNVFSVNTQYTGPSGTRANYQSTFRGAYSDTDKYPTSGCTETKEATCLTDAQVRTELKAFVEANHLPTGINAIYFVLTPPRVNVCTDTGGKGNCSNSTSANPSEPNGFCGYHSVIEPSSPGPIVYGVQPWVAGSAGRVINQLPLATEESSPDVLTCQNGSFLVEPNQTGSQSPYGDFETGLADVIISDLSVEQSEIAIDPLLNGWYQKGTNAEQGDMCQRAFSPAPEELPKPPKATHALPLSDETINGNPYYLQWAFNSAGVTSGKGLTCWQGTELRPHITSPNPVNVGDVVGFDANETSFTLDANTSNLGAFPSEEPFTAPLYNWEFGDGATMFGTNASVFHSYQYGGTYNVTLTVTDSGGNTGSVVRPVTVVGPLAPSTGGSGQGGASTSSSGGATGGGKTPPRPVAAAAVASHSLRSALVRGLVVRYSVNERVTGHFEVLLATSLARRLHVHGPVATGLANGTPSETVVGKALLVTTAGGRNSVTIQFSKGTAARLHRLHRVSLIIRFVVRNASAQSSTVLMAVALSH